MNNSVPQFDLTSIYTGSFLKHHVISLDTRFRKNYNDPSTDCTIELPTDINNVIAVKLNSFELGNIEYVFSQDNYNVCFTVSTALDPSTNICISDGNYTAAEIETAINDALTNASLSQSITFTIDTIAGTSSFSSADIFSIDFSSEKYSN